MLKNPQLLPKDPRLPALHKISTDAEKESQKLPTALTLEERERSVLVEARVVTVGDDGLEQYLWDFILSCFSTGSTAGAPDD
ncbi:hypothetical protein VTN00DRAFT_6564 [Thermoascus crustaceus]|uniref:uncharacterized protein n=1 Tax=Thermoascus crustaceus TaxID=5088 RepID=UPI003743F64E